MIPALLSLVLGFQAPLVEGQTVKFPKTGHFDYMLVDEKNHRVYASHPGASTLCVLDMKTGQATEIDTPVINGVQIDSQLNKLFVTGGGQKLVQIDLLTLKIEKQVDLTGPGDDLVIDTKRQQIYVCHDESQEDWVFDAKTLNLLGSVKIAGAPEWIAYDKGSDLLYQNIKPTDQVQIIDPKTKSVVKEWPTAPMSKPHGLAIDRKSGRVFSAGSNGKLDVMDLQDGHILATVDIVAKTDQIAFDSELKRVYCAGAGAITIVQETPSGATVLGSVPTPTGAHTIAVDAQTHTVWVCYPTTDGSCFKSFLVK